MDKRQVSLDTISTNGLHYLSKVHLDRGIDSRIYTFLPIQYLRCEYHSSVSLSMFSRLQGGETMLSVISHTMTALRAFTKKMEVTDHNLPNPDCVGHRKYLAFLRWPRGRGESDLNRVETSCHCVSRERNRGTDVRGAIPKARLADRYYHAKLQYLDTEDEALGCVLDIID